MIVQTIWKRMKFTIHAITPSFKYMHVRFVHTMTAFMGPPSKWRRTVSFCSHWHWANVSISRDTPSRRAFALFLSHSLEWPERKHLVSMCALNGKNETENGHAGQHTAQHNEAFITFFSVHFVLGIGKCTLTSVSFRMICFALLCCAWHCFLCLFSLIFVWIKQKPSLNEKKRNKRYGTILKNARQHRIIEIVWDSRNCCVD